MNETINDDETPTGVIYMDHAATTPTDEAVLEVMRPYFSCYYGNAATLYSAGVKAGEALEAARHDVALALGAEDREVIFTSGGTESDNWVLMGVAYANESRGRHIIISAVEHHAVLEPAETLRTVSYTHLRAHET